MKPMERKRTPNPAVRRAIELAGSQAKLAALCRVSQAAVSHWRRGDKQIAPAHCVRICQKFPGELTYADLRPDDWREIWPEYTPPEAPATSQEADHATTV